MSGGLDHAPIHLPVGGVGGVAGVQLRPQRHQPAAGVVAVFCSVRLFVDLVEEPRLGRQLGRVSGWRGVTRLVIRVAGLAARVG